MSTPPEVSDGESFCAPNYSPTLETTSPQGSCLCSRRAGKETLLCFSHIQNRQGKLKSTSNTNLTVTAWLGDHTAVPTIFGGRPSLAGAPSAPLQPQRPHWRSQGLKQTSQATSKFPWESESLCQQRAIESPFILSLVWNTRSGPDPFPRLRISPQGYKANSREGLD